MGAVVINLREVDDPRDAVHRAVQALAEGKLVAVPTETVYGLAASALREDAVLRLTALKERTRDQPFALAVKSSDDALDYAPSISPLAQRLARRCWPGPVTLVLPDRHRDSLIHQLPDAVQQAVCPNGSIGLRVPAHALTLDILRLTAGPVALTSANRKGQKESFTADEVMRAVGDEIDLVLDDGKSRFSQASSVVEVLGEQANLLREGVINEKSLRRLSSLIVLFVCTGNTCRSPLAESLLRKRVSIQCGCPVEDLEDHGVMVLSAGIAAMTGGRASPQSVQVAGEFGADLGQHETQPLSERLVRFADLILTMTRGHREAILAQWPWAAQRTHLLCHNQQDVADPIGGPIEAYRQCAQQIDQQLGDWLKQLDIPRSNHRGE